VFLLIIYSKVVTLNAHGASVTQLDGKFSGVEAHGVEPFVTKVLAQSLITPLTQFNV
jgi:hypothetical protein